MYYMESPTGVVNDAASGGYKNVQQMEVIEPKNRSRAIKWRIGGVILTRIGDLGRI